MTMVFNGRLNVPNYTCLTSDLMESKLPGAQPGMTIFISDAVAGSQWKIVRDDFTLDPYILPAGNAVVSGTITTVPTRSLVVQPTATPVLTVHATYVSGDYVGTSGSAMAFADCSAVNGSGGYILGALLIDGALQSISAELWIFDANITVPNDSSAWTISDADAKHLVAVIPFSTYYPSAANSVSQGSPLSGSARFVCGAGSKTLYGALVTRGAPVYADGDLTVRLTIVQD